MHIPTDLLGVVGVSCAAILMIELMQYIIIYRKPSFKMLKARLREQNRKLEEMKASNVPTAKMKAKERKEKRLENSMKLENSRQFGVMKMAQVIINMVTMFLAYRILTRLYFGVVVAKLPFEPWPFFQKLTHRGLEGTDITDASAVLIFSLCQMGVKQSLSMALGLGPNRQMQGLIAANNQLISEKYAGSGKA